MYLDIRLPIGMLFTILGLLLAAHGAMADAAIFERSLGYNVNLVWGLVILVFGIVMTVFGRRGTRSVPTAESTPEGRMIEPADNGRGIDANVPR